MTDDLALPADSEPELHMLLVLESVDPLRGRLGRDPGPTQPFTGWIGLAAALEDAIRDRAG